MIIKSFYDNSNIILTAVERTTIWSRVKAEHQLKMDKDRMLLLADLVSLNFLTGKKTKLFLKLVSFRGSLFRTSTIALWV